MCTRARGYPCDHAYPGFLGIEKLTARRSSGLIYAYGEPWEHKVPFNHNCFVSELSWRQGREYEAEVSFSDGATLSVPLRAVGR